MAGVAPDDMTRDASETAGGRAGCDILILDAMNKQSLASARRLGRTGLRVALGESAGQYRPSSPPPSFASRYCARAVTLPDYITDTASYVAEVVSFARDHHVKVVLPTGDESIAALAPHRERFAELDCVLAVASDAALEIATDKSRTLEVAAKLGIDYPGSVEVAGIAELRKAEAEFGYPFVVKPTMSWTGKTGVRVAPVEVIDEAEALDATTRFLATGAGVLAQQLASGRREGVSLFIADGEVIAHCGHVAHRTSPALGGASVMRESIEVPAEVLDAAVRLAITIGVEGACEVEFRRDASDHPLLMEINPRLAGTLENAIRSGVDFPLLIWQWAQDSRSSRCAPTAPESGRDGCAETCAGSWRTSGESAVRIACHRHTLSGHSCRSLPALVTTTTSIATICVPGWPRCGIRRQRSGDQGTDRHEFTTHEEE